MTLLRPVAAALGALACALACASGGGGAAEAPDRPYFDVELLSKGPGSREALRLLAAQFYGRIEGRRFDSIATYQDPALREFFRNERQWADYYAELVQRLGDQAFEARRPEEVQVLDVAFEEDTEEPLEARVSVRFTGQNGRPLRWWRTRFAREERWTREEGRWWIVPGKL